MLSFFVIFCFLLFSSLIITHLYYENNLAKRINKSGKIVQKLLDRNGIEHIDLKKKFMESTLSTQIRLMEYYLTYLNADYKDFGTQKSVFERISKIESVLAEYKDTISA